MGLDQPSLLHVLKSNSVASLQPKKWGFQQDNTRLDRAMVHPATKWDRFTPTRATPNMMPLSEVAFCSFYSLQNQQHSGGKWKVNSWGCLTAPGTHTLCGLAFRNALPLLQACWTILTAICIQYLQEAWKKAHLPCINLTFDWTCTIFRSFLWIPQKKVVAKHLESWVFASFGDSKQNLSCPPKPCLSSIGPSR